MNIFEQTPPNRRRYGLAAFIGLIAGVVSAFWKFYLGKIIAATKCPVSDFRKIFTERDIFYWITTVQIIAYISHHISY